ncbi:hypothetical protein KY325_02345 [Candidatus Woesearchaeota archaeon]|nr:hypothetical protein [Candidatus Woesearchaeota archaeon]MBW3017974.1 hypothetical protein [Candidatus Woesearchaeota archaeon]
MATTFSRAGPFTGKVTKLEPIDRFKVMATIEVNGKKYKHSFGNASEIVRRFKHGDPDVDVTVENGRLITVTKKRMSISKK